jgi:hypothetical protein
MALTMTDADQLVHQLGLGDYVDEYEERDGAHWYHLNVTGLHVQVGFDGSIKLVDDDGSSVDLSEEAGGNGEQRSTHHLEHNSNVSRADNPHLCRGHHAR